MGIFKGIGWFVTGGAVRPTTTRERSRMYQRQANRLLEQQLYAMQDAAGQEQFTTVPIDLRPRGTCPACLEMMLVGASTCPYCHTTGITWPGQNSSLTTVPEKVPEKFCTRCNGKVALRNDRHVYCTYCNEQLPAGEYPHLFKKPSNSPQTMATNQQSPSIKKHDCGGEVALLPGGNVYCTKCKSGLNPKQYPHLFRN